MFDVAHVPNSTAEVNNCSRGKALSHCWKSLPRCLVIDGFGWNNYEFLRMFCICQPLQVLYNDDPCPLFCL